MKSREDVASAAQRNPVSPSVAIMGAEDEDGEEEEDDDEVLKFDEEVEKKAAVVDGRCVRKLADPRRPSQAEVDEHELTHIPYRNWCAVCVRCRGKDLDHRKSVDEDRGVSEYAFDYCFPGDEFGYKLVVLAGRERVTGMYFATAVPTKGSIGRFAVDKAIDYVRELGDQEGRILVKTDQEPAIKTWLNDMIAARPDGRTIVEESPVQSSGSNGRAERAVQTLEGQIRILLLSLERRLGQRVDAKEPIVSYMPEYAAYLLNRMEVGKDGKTPYERCKGKKANVLGVEFGEKVLYKIKAEAKMMKIRPRWEYGIFVGIRPTSHQVWVATADKTVAARSIRRLPLDQRWNMDCVRWVRWTLWNRYKDDVGADGDLPEEVPQEVAPQLGPRGGGTVYIETREKVPREFYIKKTDAERHGYTRGCAGCSSWFRGLGRQPHTDACRERFRELMQDEARVQHAAAKRKEFDERQQDKRREKEEKREEKKAAKRKADVEADDSERIERGDGEVQDQDQGGDAQHGESSRGSDGEVGRGEVPGEVEMQAEDGRDACAVEVEEYEARRWLCEIAGDEDDDVEVDESFQQLDPRKVAEARAEEIGYMRQRGLWKVVPIPEGVVPVSVRWVDVLKAEGITRSRLVARDFKGDDRGRDDLFAATPPLEAIRMLISRAATNTPSRVRRKLMFIDAKRAHLNPRCSEDVYIELPPEAGEPPGVCGKLEYWLYGFRKAASEWERFYAQKLESMGFRRGEGCPVVFYHPQRDIAVAVHGDDFVLCGLDADLKWAAEGIAKCFEVKVRAVLGEEAGDDSEAVVLGRTVRWKEWGIEYEADRRHRKVLLERFGLDEGCKALSVNGEPRAGDDCDEDGQYLTNSEATEYRACVARLNFLGQDSPELQFPAKELSKDMAKPTVGSWQRLKKAVRFLVGRERVVWDYVWQEEVGSVCVFADSDWGGDRISRRSSSGGAIMLGQHCIRTWSSTQGAIALSSAEAEFYALIDAVLRAKWAQSVLSELGAVVSPVAEACTDSSAAKSFVSRRGLGKMRHLELRDLWLQREVGDGKVLVKKVLGTENPADAMTKFLNRQALQDRLRRMSLRLVWCFGPTEDSAKASG